MIRIIQMETLVTLKQLNMPGSTGPGTKESAHKKSGVSSDVLYCSVKL